MKKVLIINGHPIKDSFCNSLVQAYKKGCLSASHQVELLNLYELNFNANFAYQETLEKDLIKAQELISWANHIVIVHPIWWGSVPSLLKGFFDRAFTSGFAFKYKANSSMWDKLLSGKTGHIIYTSDTPVWINNFIFLAPSVNQVKKRTLEFCGIKPVKVTAIAPIRKSTEKFRKDWLLKVESLAAGLS